MDFKSSQLKDARTWALFSAAVLGAYFSAAQANPHSLDPESTLVRTLTANDFDHSVGQKGTHGWEVDYKRDGPGTVFTSVHGSLPLEPGLYRFSFHLRRGQYPTKGLLHDSYGLFRLEVWDVTKKEKLVERVLQIADFPQPNRYVDRWIETTTAGRKGHLFEPRVYWFGLANGEVERVDISSYPTPTPQNLEEKARRLGDQLESNFLENGFVVSRKRNGDPDETGDATTYTGWYAASLAWQYAVTHDPHAQAALERALQTLHSAIKGTYERPLLTRYVDDNGQPFPKSPSKDPYTAFFFAYATAWPYVTDATLKTQMANDASRLVSRFLKEDLTFREGTTEILNLSPFFSERVVRSGIHDLVNDRKERQEFLKALNRANALIPFGELFPGSKDVVKAIHKKDEERLFQLVVPTANGLMDLAVRVRDLLREEYRQDLFPRRSYREYPGKKLEEFLSECLARFPVQKSGRRIDQISDLKVLGSNALISLEMIRTAADVTGKARFRNYYRANLFSGTALLKTAVDWDGRDEDILRLTAGNPVADRECRGYLSVLSLSALVSMETDPVVKKKYLMLLDRWAEDYRYDDNPLAPAIVDAAHGRATHADFILRALNQYPEDRRGFGRDYWNLYGKEVGNRLGGGAENGFSAEPLPVSHRPKDSFLWQRNTRRLKGDDTKDYPPTDYLFLYWFSRYHKLIPAD